MLLHPKHDCALCSPIYFLMYRIKDGTPIESGLLKTWSSQHHRANQQCAGPVCVEQTLESSGLGPSVADSGTGPETMARPVPMPLTINWTRKGTVQFLWKEITYYRL